MTATTHKEAPVAVPGTSADGCGSDLPEVLLSGIDSLYVSYYLDTATSGFDWDELAYLKAKTAENYGEAFAKITLGNETFALMPYGKFPYTYVLRNRNFEVRLAERMQPCCYVQFFSEGLWMEGVSSLMDRMDAWIKSMKFRPTRRPEVSRVDFAFDFHLPEVDFTVDHFVSRAAKDGCWRQHRAAQTFLFGRGDVVVRVYDKVAEIEQQSGKSWFFDLWERDKDVWRVEFQLRSERLRDGGIRTFDNLVALSGDLLRELATNHTSLRCPTKDRNRSRWPLHPLWAVLIEHINLLPQTGLVRDLEKSTECEYQAHKVTQSLYGLLKRLAVLTYFQTDGTQKIDLEFMLAELPGLLEPHHSDESWRLDVAKKLEAYRLGV